MFCVFGVVVDDGLLLLQLFVVDAVVRCRRFSFFPLRVLCCFSPFLCVFCIVLFFLGCFIFFIFYIFWLCDVLLVVGGRVLAAIVCCWL